MFLGFDTAEKEQPSKKGKSMKRNEKDTEHSTVATMNMMVPSITLTRR